MREGLTEVVFILDRSGSMSGLESDTIGGFNAMMEKQKKEEGEAYVTTVLFDDRYEVLYDRVSIGEVPKMTEKDYYVRGCTALLDAMGETIKHISKIQKSAPEEERPGKTLFVITTDGLENSSRKYNYEKIKKMVGKKREKGWQFIFIGANIDSVLTAERVGIQREHAVNYVHDGEGTAHVYNSVGKAVGAMRRAQPAQACMAMRESGWAAEIQNDFKKRMKK